MNTKKIFLITILSLALVLSMFSGDKVKAVEWACFRGDACSKIEAADIAQATTACNTGGTYIIQAGTCPSPGVQNSTSASSPAKSCVCSGEVSVNLLGKAAASAAGLNTENVCKQYKGTFVSSMFGGDSCKNLQVNINSTGQAECEKITKEQIMTKLGIPSNISSLGDFTASCSWKVVDTSQSSAKQSPVLQTGCKITGGQEICSLENPLTSGADVSGIISIVIKSALGIIGALTLLMLVWGGFQWLTSAGNPEKVKSGAQTMVWAIIGVILVFASYILLSTFTGYLTGTQ